MEVNGTVRVNALSYWFKNVAGFSPVYDEKTSAFTCKFPESNAVSEIEGIKFSYDPAHAAIIKDNRYTFWKVAPKDTKALTIFDDIKKVTAGIESQFARGLELGTVTEEEVQEHISKLMERVQEARASKATKEWVKKFQAQSHVEPEPTEEPVNDELLAMLDAE